MNFKSALTTFALVVTCAVLPSARAIPVTYQFVVSSLAGGGTFSAEATVDNTPGVYQAPVNPLLSFTATLTGNSFSPTRTWDLSEVTFAQWVISPSGGLTFSGLQAADTIGTGYFLNGGSTGFSAPTTIGGVWGVKPSAAVPEGGSLATSLLALLAVSWMAFRTRRTS